MTQGRSWNVTIGVLLAVIWAVAPEAAAADAADAVAPMNAQVLSADFEVPTLPYEDTTPWPIFCPPDELPPAVNPPPVEVPVRTPAMAAPLPPAVISGGLLLAGNGLMIALRKRWI